VRAPISVGCSCGPVPFTTLPYPIMGGRRSARSAPKSAEEEERVRNNWRWLGGVGVIAASYILFSAGMFTVVSEDEEYYEDDDFELVDE